VQTLTSTQADTRMNSAKTMPFFGSMAGEQDSKAEFLQQPKPNTKLQEFHSLD